MCGVWFVPCRSGRLLHHLAEVSGFKLSGVEIVVFDEADRMFEMGFAEQVRTFAVAPC
jgi:superfamily II DNA/RNA helicase